jgi:putative transposase
MPRTARAARGGWCYHIVSRGNRRADVFHASCDFLAFEGLIVEAQSRAGVDLLAACLMPNHIHLIVRPLEDGDMAAWMHWLLTTHVRRFHARHETSGRIWQGRYKAFPIEQDGHLLTVMRYVERNALRAGLVPRAEAWRWGSLAWRLGLAPGPRLTDPPCPLPVGWDKYVNEPQTPAELEAIRICASREVPFGSIAWAAAAAEDLGLDLVEPAGSDD